MTLKQLLSEIILKEKVDINQLSDEFFESYWESVNKLEILARQSADTKLHPFIDKLNDIGNLIENHIDSGK